MKNICVIGDSHTACLKNAWDKICYKNTDVAVTFFANPSDGMKNLKAKNGKLVATTSDLNDVLSFTSNGALPIDFEDYDVVFLYGLKLGEYIKTSGVFSEAVSKQAIIDHIHQSLLWSVLEQVRLVTNKEVHVGLKPLLSSSLSYRNVHVSKYLRGIEKMNDYVFKKKNSVLLAQPLKTLENGIRTKEKFAMNSSKFISPRSQSRSYHSDDDPTHMNDKFGELYIKQMLSI